MRVLLVVQQLRRRVSGGIGTYSTALIGGLGSLESGLPTVNLLASRRFGGRPRRPAGGTLTPAADAAPHDPLARLGFPLEEPRLPGTILQLAWDVGLVSAPPGYEVVHSLALGGPRSKGAVGITTVHDMAWHDFPWAYPARGRRWHEAALARAIRRSDHFVVPSEETADRLVATGVNAKVVEVIAHGSDHLPPPDEGATASLLASLGVRCPYLLTIGTLEPRKNLGRLFAAYAKIRDELQQPLVVVGPEGWGEAPRPVRGIVLAGSVGDAVLSGLLAGATLLAYVPLAEGFGLPALEAMAAGVPVVASPVPATGGVAVEVDPYDVDSIAAGLVRVGTEDELRGALVAAGKDRAAGLSWRSTARRHVELWEHLAGKASRCSAPLGSASPGRAPTDDAAFRLSFDVSAVPARSAGVGRYALELVGWLQRRRDVELTLVTRLDDAERWSAIAPYAQIEAVAPVPRPFRLAWEQARLPRLLGRLAVEVHHGPHYTMPEGASVPTVVTVHDLTFFDHPEWHERSKTLFFRRAIRVAARKAAALICVSETTAQRLQDLFDPAGEVYVIHHGVDHARFCAHEPEPGTDEVLISRLGVSQPYVAFIGTLEPRKDVPNLVRAFDRICTAHPGLSLVLAGMPGWGSAQVDAAVADCRHPDRVFRIGYVPDEAVPALLRRASAVAYPSLKEGFGLPSLEALACGSPLVTTSGSAMEELTEGAALLVPPGDTNALAGALDMLVRGDAGLNARRAKGIEVARRHTWEASAEAHMAAYRSVLLRASADRVKL